MALIHFHSDDPKFPTNSGMGHDGYWSLALGDGTHLMTLRHSGYSIGKKIIQQAASLHPDVLCHMIPSVKSGVKIHSDTTKSANKYLGTQEIEHTTHTLLTGIFEKLGDPVHDPDGTI